MDYLPINDYDISAITNETNKWKAAGYYADYDLSKAQQGIAVLVIENLATNDGSIAYFEIHKFGKRRFLGTSKRWIVQLYSSQKVGSELTKHGCVSAKILVSAIMEANRDMKHGFLSVCDFDLAVSANS